MGRRRPSHHWCAYIQPRGPLTVAAAPPWLQQLLALSPGGQDRLWTASSSSAVGSEWPCCFFNDAQTQAPPCAAATALLPRYPTNLLLCVAGIFIFPWGGDTADWYPLDGGAYVGLNVVLGPHLQPNATRAWMEIGKKIRAGQGQSLPTLGDEAHVRAEAEEEEMPASLEEAHRVIRSLRAQLGNGA